MLKNQKEINSFKKLINLIDESYDAYLFSCMFSTSHKIYKKISRIIQIRKKLLIFGGIYSTGFSNSLFSGKYCNVVIKHEGEKQIVNFLKFWEGFKADLRNTSYLYRNKVYNYPMLFEKIDPPNILPQLNYLKKEIKNYNKYGYLGISSSSFSEGRLSATILSNRGCRAALHFVV